MLCHRVNVYDQNGGILCFEELNVHIIGYLLLERGSLVEIYSPRKVMTDNKILPLLREDSGTLLQMSLIDCVCVCNTIKIYINHV